MISLNTGDHVGIALKDEYSIPANISKVCLIWGEILNLNSWLKVKAPLAQLDRIDCSISEFLPFFRQVISRLNFDENYILNQNLTACNTSACPPS